MSELTGLQKFARELLTASSEGCDFGGDEVQELALKHNLVRVESYDPEVHTVAQGSEVLTSGDDIYCFNDVIETKLTQNSRTENINDE